MKSLSLNTRYLHAEQRVTYEYVELRARHAAVFINHVPFRYHQLTNYRYDETTKMPNDQGFILSVQLLDLELTAIILLWGSARVLVAGWHY